MEFFNWFINPVKEHYADFNGRATRQQYWMFVLVSALISIALGIVDGLAGTQVIGYLFSLAVLVPSIAIAARRLHDIGKSGWWQLVSLVPLIGFIIMIVWLVRKGQTEANQYGQAPGQGSVATASAQNADGMSARPTPEAENSAAPTQSEHGTLQS